MEDLKIRVNSEAESEDVQGLFFEMGYKWFSGGNQVQHLKQSCSSSFGYLVAWSNGCFTYVIQCGCGNEDAKEITLPQLRDLVVLKRNDTSDATHENSHGQSLLKVSNGWYISKETLNDKVASAEIARQEFIGAPFSDLPEFNFGAIDDFVESNVEQDNVNQPSHYNKGGVECIDAIQSSMTHEAFCGYLKGNVQKYMWRYENKGGVESLEKAQWYLNKLIEVRNENSSED